MIPKNIQISSDNLMVMKEFHSENKLHTAIKLYISSQILNNE